MNRVRRGYWGFYSMFHRVRREHLGFYSMFHSCGRDESRPYTHTGPRTWHVVFRPAGHGLSRTGRQDGKRFQRILYSAVPATGSDVRLRDRTVTARKSVGFFTVTGAV